MRPPGTSIRARHGALPNTRGDIALKPELPRLYDMWRALLARDAQIPPWYRGIGAIPL